MTKLKNASNSTNLTPEDRAEIKAFMLSTLKGYNADGDIDTIYVNLDRHTGPGINFVGFPDNPVEYEYTEELLAEAIDKVLDTYLETSDAKKGFFIYTCGDNREVSLDHVDDNDTDQTLACFESETLESGRHYYIGYD